MVKDNDYVFLPVYGEMQRDSALKHLQWQFEIMMWNTGLAIGGNGEASTLYSLRQFGELYSAHITTDSLNPTQTTKQVITLFLMENVILL